MPFDISIDDAQKQYPEYTFLSRLTLSSYKAAFKVQDEAGDTYCLKILSPANNQNRVLREVQSHTSFHHPNISTLYKHIYMDEGGLIKHYLLEEFIDGVDLSDKIDKGYVFEENEAISFFTQLASALAELSRHNIVHRDIKPSNIRVRNCGSPVLIDFGTVRCLDQSSLTATFQGAGIGTCTYFAPEQFSGSRHNIDCRTDQFPLGIIMYQCLLGVHPFWNSQDTYEDLADSICNSREYLNNEEFRKLDKKWQSLISKLLKTQRVHRFHNPEQIIKFLDK